MANALWETRLLMFDTEEKKNRALKSRSRSSLIAQARYFLEAGNANTGAMDGLKAVALNFLDAHDLLSAATVLRDVPGHNLAMATDGEIHGISDAQACLERAITL